MDKNSDAIRKGMFAHCDRLGFERVEHDLLFTRGSIYVGGTLEQQEYAWQWFYKQKAARANALLKRESVISIKPKFFGVEINVNLLWRRMKQWFVVN